MSTPNPYFRLSLLLTLTVSAILGCTLIVRNNLTTDGPVPVCTLTAYADDHEPTGRKIHKAVDQMPLFPGAGCGDIMDYKKRKKCSEKDLLSFIYEHVRYPKKARDRGVQGLAIVSFVVEPHGALTNIKIARDPGTGLGRAAEKVVELMREENLRWEPGLHQGKPVRVQFNLPVKFKLEE